MGTTYGIPMSARIEREKDLEKERGERESKREGEESRQRQLISDIRLRFSWRKSSLSSSSLLLFFLLSLCA